MSKKIVKVEVRYAMHIPKNEERDDYHYVKELVHYDDGTKKNRFRLLHEYMRPVYVTAPNARNHREKKEYESLDNLICREATESDKYDVAGQMLGMRNVGGRKWLVNKSPYVYGLGMTAASLIKLESIKRNGGSQSPYTVATFDVETNPSNNDLRVASIVMEFDGVYNIFAVVDRKWAGVVKDVERHIYSRYKEHYPDIAKKSKLTVQILDTQLEMIRNIFLVANKWEPDFLSIWNMEFDLHDVILHILKKHNANPIDYICDQSVPRELRVFDFVKSASVVTTASGVVKPKPPADRWHKVYSTTRFHFIDAMCTYRALRLHKQKEYSYSLDYILHKHLGVGKLNIEEAKNLSGLKWHLWMQKNRIVDYIVYNFGDNIGPLELDKKTKDLSVSLPVFAEATEFNDFGSSNEKAYCSLYEYCLEDGLVIGVGANMSDVYDKYAKDKSIEGREVYTHRTFSTVDWIQTLPQENVLPVGLRPFKDYPYIITGSRGNVGDMDSVSSYPSCTIAGNVSKATNVTMLSSIEGLREETAKEMCLGLIVGNTNTLEICHELFNLPSAEEVIEMCMDGSIDRL